MKLTIKGRLILQSVIIKQGGIIDLTLAKSVIDKTNFTSDEITLYEMRDTPQGAAWNPAKEIEPKEINFTVEELGVIKKSVRQKDEAGELYIDMVDFCNQIMAM